MGLVGVDVAVTYRPFRTWYGAYRWPIGIATVWGWSEADTYAGSSSAPCGDVTRRTSPFTIPCFFATSAGTSTQASHAACVIVSGTSCSHALPALRPS